MKLVLERYLHTEFHVINTTHCHTLELLLLEIT